MDRRLGGQTLPTPTGERAPATLARERASGRHLPAARNTAPHTAAPAMRWGILGSGKISSDLATALRASGSSARLRAIAARQLPSAAEFAERFDVPQALGGGASALAACDDVRSHSGQH